MLSIEDSIMGEERSLSAHFLSTSEPLLRLVKTFFTFHWAYLEVSTRKVLSGAIRSYILLNHYMDS